MAGFVTIVFIFRTHKKKKSLRKKDVPNYRSLIERINNASKKTNCIIKAICLIRKSIIDRHCKNLFRFLADSAKSIVKIILKQTLLNQHKNNCYVAIEHRLMLWCFVEIKSMDNRTKIYSALQGRPLAAAQ